MKKIGFISYPMLFQKQGGLQVQINETLSAIQALGYEAVLIDTLQHTLSDFDIIHIFGISNGNYHIAKIAVEQGCKVVVSPLVRNDWNKNVAFRVKLIDRILSKFSHYLTNSVFALEYKYLKKCHHYIALGDAEKQSLSSAYDLPEHKISVIKNGIASHFFDANATEFNETHPQDKPFVLQVGTINTNKNQLTLAQTLKHYFPEMQLVLIGPVGNENKGYLTSILAVGNVTYLGAMDAGSTLLRSAYSAANILVLPSHSEVYPLTALEALACGTPVLVTKNSAMNFPCSHNEFQLIEPSSNEDIANKIKATLQAKPSNKQCQSLVDGFTWQHVAKQLAKIYQSL